MLNQTKRFILFVITVIVITEFDCNFMMLFVWKCGQKVARKLIWRKIFSVTKCHLKSQKYMHIIVIKVSIAKDSVVRGLFLLQDKIERTYHKSLILKASLPWGNFMLKPSNWWFSDFKKYRHTLRPFFDLPFTMMIFQKSFHFFGNILAVIQLHFILTCTTADKKWWYRVMVSNLWYAYTKRFIRNIKGFARIFLDICDIQQNYS